MGLQRKGGVELVGTEMNLVAPLVWVNSMRLVKKSLLRPLLQQHAVAHILHGRNDAAAVPGVGGGAMDLV